MPSGPARAQQLRHLLATRSWVMGTAITLEDPTAVETAAVAGYDFVRIEREHSPITDATFVNQMRAADAHDLPVLVRVMDTSTRAILPVLEAGAAGILVAHVRNREEAAAAVREVRFPPLGQRSVYTKSRAARFGGTPAADYIRDSNEQLLVGLLIEDAEGLANAADMAELEGVDFLSMGRFDFAASVGHALATNHPDVAAAEEAIIEAAQAAGKMASMSAHSPQQVRQLRDKGVRFLLTDADGEAMLRGWSERLEAYRRVLDGA